jgi:undecaprenyl-diphosphatase
MRLSYRALVGFALALLASVVFVVIARELRVGALDELDTAGALAVHRLDCAPLDVVMLAATYIGTSYVMIPVVAVVFALAFVRRHRLAALVLGMDTVVVMTANALLKVMFARDRPTLFDKIAMPTDYSFPSGHAMNAMGVYGAVAVVLALLYPRARRWLAVGTAVLIGGIGLSRVYLGVHWPFDVLAGYAGGVPPLVVTAHVVGRVTACARQD